jgi:16S rRNA processing protein RimM
MATTPLDSDELVELAAVARAHGLRGELSLKPFNPDSDLLSEIDAVVLKLPSGETRRFAVDGARGHAGQLILGLEGVRDRDAAEALRGALVCVPRSALPEPAEDEYYLVDLVGLEARDAAGARVGRVEDILQYPSVACLLVRGDAGSWEVPDTERYLIEVAVEQGYVVVDHLDELEPLPAKEPR